MDIQDDITEIVQEKIEASKTKEAELASKLARVRARAEREAKEARELAATKQEVRAELRQVGKKISGTGPEKLWAIADRVRNYEDLPPEVAEANRILGNVSRQNSKLDDAFNREREMRKSLGPASQFSSWKNITNYK